MMKENCSTFLIIFFVLPCSAFLVSHSNVDARNTNAASRLFVASPEKEGLAGNLTTVDQAMTLQQQAQALREEALALRNTLEASKIEKIIKENTKIDQWIEELFVQYQIDENTEMLNDVDQVFERLKDDRYSQEQVNKIFNRICETGPPQSRSNCSPVMSTLVDAVGKLDSVERDDNPNKRWSGRVERVLRKRLFALDWGMDLEDDDDEGNPWRIG